MTRPNVPLNIKNAKHRIERAGGAPYLAECLDDDGRTYEKANPGFIWVREILSVDPDTGGVVRGQAYQVRAAAAFIPYYGARVRVEYDLFDAEWGISKHDFKSFVEQGGNPAVFNPLNPYLRDTDMESLPMLKSFAVSDGNTATTEISIKNYVGLDHLGDLLAFRLADGSRPDVATYAPGTSLKRLVHFWLDYDNTIAVSQGTPIGIGEDFDVFIELAEVVEDRPNQLARPIGVWIATNGMTATTPNDFYCDTRQWIDNPPMIGMPNPVINNFLIPDGITVTHAGDLTVTGNLTVLGDLVVLDEDTRITSVGGTFGDAIAGDYSIFEDDGTLEFNGAATVWEDLRIPGLAVEKGASAPNLISWVSGGSLQVNGFDGINTSEQVFFTCQMPHSYKLGSDIYPHIHWGPTDTNAGNVKWFLEYSWANIGDVFPAVTSLNVVTAASGTQYDHQLSSFATIDGTGKTLSSMIVCRMYRNPADGEDTYAHDAGFLEFDFHYQIDTIGSREVLAK